MCLVIKVYEEKPVSQSSAPTKGVVEAIQTNSLFFRNLLCVTHFVMDILLT